MAIDWANPVAVENATNFFNTNAADQAAQRQQAYSQDASMQRARLDSAYRVASLQAKTAAQQLAVDKAYKQASLKLNALELSLKGRQFGLAQSQARTGIVENLAKMQGAENPFEETAYLRGVAQTGDLPPSLQSLQKGGVLPLYQAPAGAGAATTPQPVEKQGAYNAMASELGTGDLTQPWDINTAQVPKLWGSGGLSPQLAGAADSGWRMYVLDPRSIPAMQGPGAAGLSDYLAQSTAPNSPLGRLPAETDAYRAGVRGLLTTGAGIAGLGPQALEQLFPTESLNFWQAVGKEGFNPNDIRSIYLRSRITNNADPGAY